MSLHFKPEDFQLEIRPDGALNLSVQGQHVASIEPDVAAQLSKVQLSCFMRAFPLRWKGNIEPFDIESLLFINNPLGGPGSILRTP